MKYHRRFLLLFCLPGLFTSAPAQLVPDSEPPCEDGFHWSYRKDVAGGYSWNAAGLYEGVANPEFIGRGTLDDPLGIHVFNVPDPFKTKRIWLEMTFGPEVELVVPVDPGEPPTLGYKGLVFPVTFLDDTSGSFDSFFDVFTELDTEPADSFFDVFVEISIDGPVEEKTMVWYWELFPQPPEEWILFNVPTELTVTPALLLDLESVAGLRESLPIIGIDIYSCCIPEPTAVGLYAIMMTVGMARLRRRWRS